VASGVKSQWSTLKSKFLATLVALSDFLKTIKTKANVTMHQYEEVPFRRLSNAFKIINLERPCHAILI